MHLSRSVFGCSVIAMGQCLPEHDTMTNKVRTPRCPVCNGRMEYKAIDYWGGTPKNVCSQCGYDGSFAIEWEDDDQMRGYHPKEWKQRRKGMISLKDDANRSLARMYVILEIISLLLAFGVLIVYYIHGNY